MNRKLKASALALTAIIAMSALAASSAHAVLTSSSSHTILSGVQEGSMEFTAGSGFGAVTCTTVSFAGTSESTTTVNMAVTPTISTCKDSLGRTIHIAKNTLGSTITDSGGKSDTSGEAVLNTTNGGGSVVCITTIKAQTNQGSAVENLGGTNGIKVEINSNNAVSTTSGGLFNCGIANGEHNNGTVKGNVLVKGVDTAGNPVSISAE